MRLCQSIQCLIFVLGIFVSKLNADTPANCTYEDIRGVWKFYEGPRGQDKTVDCSSFKNSTVYTVQLEFPDNAVDDQGNVGFWTIIYNQGFEVVIGGRKYFAFSYYTQKGDQVTSYCKKTFPSTSHNVGVNSVNWACFLGEKQDDSQYLTPSRKANKNQNSILKSFQQNQLYKHSPDFIERINNKQTSWKAQSYEFLQKMTIGELVRMSGGKNSKINQKPKPARVSPEIEAISSSLPDSFDWRNVSGVNYVSPIRNQQTCGSCYAFGSMALHEARIRIKTNNQEQPVFSTQDIVECSKYSQGCDGGFPYLVAGKYAEDYGIVEESCNPYKGVDGQCHTYPKCSRYYATNYTYIGGFYGACNEALMRISLVRNGPVAVSFEVYNDFLVYQGGIYHHTAEKDSVNFKFNPWEITNHVVLVVGYGADQSTGEKYWIVKNSWGTGWGESGFFRIRRGTDECSIESIAVEADIIPM